MERFLSGAPCDSRAQLTLKQILLSRHFPVSMVFIAKRAFRDEIFLYSITTPLTNEDFFLFPS